MGLHITVKGFKKPIFDNPYSEFFLLRLEIAKAYSEETYILYKKYLESSLHPESKLSVDEWLKFKSNTPDGLRYFLLHSDCDGKITPKYCKMIYEVTSKMKCDYLILPYKYNFLQNFNEALKYCIEKKKTMFFS